MDRYFEVDGVGEIVSFDNLDDAIEFADSIGSRHISEIGGSWTDYAVCDFCGHWFDACHLNTHDECPICQQIIYQQLKERY